MPPKETYKFFFFFSLLKKPNIYKFECVHKTQYFSQILIKQFQFPKKLQWDFIKQPSEKENDIKKQIE